MAHISTVLSIARGSGVVAAHQKGHKEVEDKEKRGRQWYAN